MSKRRTVATSLLILLIFVFESQILLLYAWEDDKIARVTNIVDGDTFDIDTEDRIRLADIDAPEPDARARLCHQTT